MKARFGRYVLLKKLAAGGMAEVFLARRLSFGGFARFCVIKRLLPEHSGRKAYVRLFLAEARTGALLNHPNIVGLHDLGQIDDAYFMAMEYVHGVSAAEILARSTQVRKPVPIGAALRIVGSVAEALHYAHHAVGLDGQPLGIIHHDVSPHNAQVSFEGDVKLLDFGVATRHGHAPTGGRRGKYGYMSPEAIERGRVDHRSDLYSLGVVLYELTTGRKLFKGDGTTEPPADLSGRRSVEPPTRVDAYYPASLEEVVMQALSEEADARFPDAGAFHRALGEVGRKLGAATGADALAAWLRELFGEEIEQRRLELAELAAKSDPKPKSPRPAGGTPAPPTEVATAPTTEGTAPSNGSWGPGEGSAGEAPAVAAGDAHPDASTEPLSAGQTSPATGDPGAASDREAPPPDGVDVDLSPSGVDVDLDDDLEGPEGPVPAFEASEAVLAQEAPDESPAEVERTGAPGPALAAPPPHAAIQSWRRAALGLAIAGVALSVVTLFIGRRWGQPLAPPPEAPSGSLFVESIPEGARVYDGQRLLGMTPITATKLALGARYELRIVAPGHAEHRVSAALGPDRPHVFVTAALRPDPPAPPPPSEGVPTAQAPVSMP